MVAANDHGNPGRPGQRHVDILQLHDVGVRLNARTIFQGVTADVAAGEFVALLGPNGAGKTTLLRAIIGMLPIFRGTISVGGHPPGRGDPCLGYAPQRRLLDPDVPLRGSELVRLGLEGHRWGLGVSGAKGQRRVQEAVAAVGAEAYADAPVGRLSGGELQRLLLAQALIGSPQLLLLDEPLANLDLHFQQELVQLIFRVSKERGAAVVLVAHDVNPLLPVLDWVLYLAGGRSAIGRPEDVIRPDVLSRLYGSPVDVFSANGRLFVSAGGGHG